MDFGFFLKGPKLYNGGCVVELYCDALLRKGSEGNYLMNVEVIKMGGEGDGESRAGGTNDARKEQIVKDKMKFEMGRNDQLIMECGLKGIDTRRSLNREIATSIDK